jgi:hypothetical protein
MKNKIANNRVFLREGTLTLRDNAEALALLVCHALFGEQALTPAEKFSLRSGQTQTLTRDQLKVALNR